MSRKLIKSTLVVGGMTLLSRISGLLRDIVFANVMGSGLVADAFFVAFRIPNFFRRIFGEGAFSQAFVPVYSEYRERQDANATRTFLDHMAGRLGLILLAVSVAGIVFAPQIVHLLAWGWVDDAEKIEVTVAALRICFPYVLCICLVAMAAGILNTHGRFAAPAATPVLLNLCLIAAALWLTQATRNAAIALAIGVLVAGILQLVFQAPFLKREKAMPVPKFRRRDEGVARVFSLMLPAVFGVSVAQVNIIINTFLASFLVTGSVSWLYYSDRVMEFPLGVFGIALATVILPSLSKLHARGEGESFSNLLDWSLRWVCLIAVPASIGLMVLALPIIATLFHHGATSTDDVRMMSYSLIAYALGLVGFVLVKVLAPGFFARQDTKTPFRVAVIALIANIVLAVLLFTPMGHVGLALATTVAAWVNAGLLYRLLRERMILSPRAGWAALGVKVALASSAMAGCLWWGAGEPQWWLQAGLMERVWRLTVWIMLGGAVYFGVMLVSGIRPGQFVLKKADFDQ